MRSNLKTVVMVIALASSAGCSTINGWFGGGEQSAAPALAEEPKKEVKETPEVYGVNNKELELKLTKLWARVDELESEIIRQKERVKLLEKGLLTGIAPEELLRKGEEARKDSEGDVDLVVKSETELPKKLPDQVVTEAAKEAVPPSDPASAAAPPAATTAATTATHIDEKSYQEKLTKAHGLFSGEHWGQAIAAYGAIGTEYPESITQGHHLYWIGVSWFNLKEYQLSLKHLEEFVTKYNSSPLVPKSHFYMAKSEYRMGFIEKALQRYKNVIRDFPADEAAKMAKWELSKINEAL